MNWNDLYMKPGEKPLDRFVEGISNTAIFRTIGFIGDSLSSGEMESRNAQGQAGYHDYYEYSWGQYIARKNGLTAYNMSRGGMSAKTYIQSFADENRFWDPGKACQAYVLALGVNDVVNTGEHPGTVADIDPEDESRNKPTFAGYYAQIIARLKKIQPRAKFFLMTMPRTERDEPLKREHRELLYALAEYYDNTYVIDLYEYGPVHDQAFRDRFYLYGHLNPSGYILTANMVDSYMDYIIRSRPEEFARVPFIGTELK